jgi:signal transduction histidine kinase
MTPDQVEQLFQPFNRLGMEMGAEIGTGVGLVVTKYLIEQMEGAVGAVSTPGMGSTFWIDLPLATEPLREVAAA